MEGKREGLENNYEVDGTKSELRADCVCLSYLGAGPLLETPRHLRSTAMKCSNSPLRMVPTDLRALLTSPSVVC